MDEYDIFLYFKTIIPFILFRMKFSTFTFSALFAISFLKNGSCAPSSPALPTQDAPYTDSIEKMKATIECPNGIGKGKKGAVLLVPGTTLNGKDSFEQGPYNQLLPKQGFDVCWVSPPNRQMADSQVSGEYVAYAINYVADRSLTKKVKVLGHSQGGGLSIPWATIFFPSARKKVSSFVAEAGDFKGTTLLPYPACVIEKIASGGQGCAPAFLQQERGSNFLKAQDHFLTSAIVPTTSIWTRTDEVVIPQFGPNPSSALPGAVWFPLQDYCSILELSDHLSIIANPAAYAIALNAFNSPTGKADLSKFNPLTDCFNIANSALDLNDIGATIRYFAGIGTTVIDSGGAYTQSEPPLKECMYLYKNNCVYKILTLSFFSTLITDVCKAGAATQCGVPGPIPPAINLSDFVEALIPEGTKVYSNSSFPL